MGTLLERVPDEVRFTTSVEALRLNDVSFLDIAEHFSGRPGFVLLESRGERSASAAFSFLCFAPFARLSSSGHGSVVRVGDRAVASSADPFTRLDELIARYRAEPSEHAHGVPFVGGAVGYLAYELGRHVEVLPQRASNDLGLPECHLDLYNFTIAEHRESGTVWLCHMASMGQDIGVTKEQVYAELAKAPPGIAAKRAGRRIEAARMTFVPELTKSQYLEAIGRIKEYIHAGDVYQVNMTQRLRSAIGHTRSWDIYRHLAEINPAPFAAYLSHQGHSIVSSSPERFLRVRGRSVETRPIKGTTARGASAEEDRRNRARLLASAKDRAELAMIVDVLRNDLGRVCRPGSVQVEAFPEIESYPSVHHLVATIRGELDEGRTPGDVLKATFPGGSITGAPKIRAMEIIDELEPVARGAYTGCIGYVGFDGSLDFNIAIRTLIVKDGQAYVHAGSGVVADSVAEDEYEECLLKADRLLEAVRAAAGAI